MKDVKDMKVSRILFGVIAVAVSMSAFAQQTVKTEAERDRANLNSLNNYPVIKFESTKTRAEVIAELEAARKGLPNPSTAARPAQGGASPQSGTFDSSLYNGA